MLPMVIYVIYGVICEWWDAGVIMCLGQGTELLYGPADATATHYLLLQ